MTYEEKEKAYDEIFKQIEKSGVFSVDSINALKKESEDVMFTLYLKEKCGFNLPTFPILHKDGYSFNYNMGIFPFGSKYNRDISCPDNGEQPTDEILLCLKFPTGAFMFEDDYPVFLFLKFFNELKSYNPKYIDTINKSLYFSLENAGKIFNDYSNIEKKYRDMSKEEMKLRKIKKLEDEINSLKGEVL